MHTPELAVARPPGSPVDWLRHNPLAPLLESTGEGIFGVDLDGLCTFINPAGARMLGWSAEHVLGQNMHTLTHHSHADGSAYPVQDCPIFNAFRRGEPCRIDAEVFWRQDGRPFPVEYSSYPLIEDARVRGAVITFVDITERRRAAEALQKAKDELELRVTERTGELSAALAQLRELAAYSEKVREDERTRIAREVHDELGSLLVALKMDVNWLDKRLGEQEARSAEDATAMRTRMRCKCQNMSRLIETAVDNVGRIITDLRPSILDHQGLWAALEWHAHDFLPAAELQLDWHMDVPASLELPGPQAMALFRIFQEMLSNVVRHARASRVTVQIGLEGDALFIEVQDNGRGASPQAFVAPDAYGVMGMRERARQIGATVDISSQIGWGSTCSVRMPLSKLEQA
jgi:PAS domain S-box-containing protein